jgi:Rrf2 family protein
MKISTKTRYGTRFLIALAAQHGKGPVYMKDIAQSEGISEKYLSQILITLRSAGLVEGFRGVHGGYVLTRPPSQITVREIVSLLEGGLSIIDCTAAEICPRSGQCSSRDVWKKIEQTLSEVLESITLEQLAAHHQGQKQPKAMYFI